MKIFKNRDGNYKAGEIKNINTFTSLQELIDRYTEYTISSGITLILDKKTTSLRQQPPEELSPGTEAFMIGLPTSYGWCAV